MGRKPIIVRGARQVGKTYVIEEFAKENFSSYIKINFEERPELMKLFEKNNAKLIINELSILFNSDIEIENTLIFIDEIQVCPKAIHSLRYFFEQLPNLHIIAAGSLLDHALNEIQYSMPVGRVEFLYMYPMSFKEFLWANDKLKLAEYIDHFDFSDNFSEVIDKQIREFLRYYFFIGGMPEAVKQFTQYNNLIEVSRIHRNIITSIKYDFSKYGTRKQQEYMNLVFLYGAKNIGRKVKYVNINRDIRSIALKEASEKLELSRLIHLVKRTNASGVPINSLINPEHFKLVFFDIGLSNHVSKIQLVDLYELMTINEGMLAEQYVGQELLAGSESHLDPELYYWNREEKNSNAEIDFIYQNKNKLYPIEVKAGKIGTLKSLQIYLAEKKLNVGIRLNLDLPSIGDFNASVRTGNKTHDLNYKLISLPLYMTNRISNLLTKLLDKESF